MVRITLIIHFFKNCILSIGKWKEEYYSYVTTTISIIFIIGCSLFLSHVKNELESGYCDFYDGECCAQWLIGDGQHDEQNKFLSCGYFDGGDYQSDGQHCNESLIDNGQCDQINIHSNCCFDGGDCCTDVLITNRFCNEVNSFLACSYFDGGDCRPPNITDWPECPHNPALIGDGTCDDHLVNAECNFDGFECCDKPELVGNGQCDDDLKNNKNCNYDNGDCCDTSWIGDGECDGYNNFASCGNYDGGDCL